MATLQDAGRTIITARLIANTQVLPTFVGLGTGTIAESRTQTALITEFTTGTWTGYARAAGTPTQFTTGGGSTNDSWQLAGPTFTAPGAETVQEAACFDAVTGGNMMIRGLTGAVTLAAGDSIVCTFKLQFT